MRQKCCAKYRCTAVPLQVNHVFEDGSLWAFNSMSWATTERQRLKEGFLMTLHGMAMWVNCVISVGIPLSFGVSEGI